MLQNIVIEETTHSPRIEFYTNGRLLLEGRSIPEDAAKMYDPLIHFVTNLDKETVVLDINLEYFNTATSKKLMELLRHLDANNKIFNLYINWHYEEGDDDSVETAEIYEEYIRKGEFRYLEYAENA
jgi:hypothetical protein